MNGLELEQSYQLINDRMRYIPENYESIACISTSADIDVLEWFKLPASSPSSNIILWELPGRDRTLYPNSPINVNISKGDSLYFAENEKLGIYASGESTDTAIEDFVDQVLYFYEHYKNISSEKVTGEARRLKNLYNNNFKEEKE